MLIAESPLTYPKVFLEYRRVMLRCFPYAIFYLVEPDRVVIAAVMHMRRDPATWKGRLTGTPGLPDEQPGG
jgi:plasmid stabilization system protein ParE